ncbi:hypothetical protein C8R44DRAFT_881638 [Mycena epipterygia]|nr:hypothetical protein C8R44DRAFT_881638 [Mycena epipterygia]
MSQSYSLLVQSLDGFSWNPGLLHKKEPNLYVGIDVDGIRAHQTHTVNRDLVPKWNDVCTLSSDQLSSRLSFHVYHKTRTLFNNDSCLATVDIDIATLWERCGTLGTSEKTVALELMKKDTKIKSAGKLSVRLAVIGIVEGGKIEVTSAQKDVEGLGNPAAVPGFMGVADTIVKVQSKADDIGSSLVVLISKIDIIAVKQQQDTDDKIIELVQMMVTTYSFVVDIESLPEKIKGLEDTCLVIIKQTVECAIFIREYTGTGFGGKLVKQVLSDRRQRIADLFTVLRALKESFDTRLAIHTAFVSANIQENVERLVGSDMLRALEYVDMNAALRM